MKGRAIIFSAVLILSFATAAGCGKRNKDTTAAASQSLSPLLSSTINPFVEKKSAEEYVNSDEGAENVDESYYDSTEDGDTDYYHMESYYALHNEDETELSEGDYSSQQEEDGAVSRDFVFTDEFSDYALSSETLQEESEVYGEDLSFPDDISGVESEESYEEEPAESGEEGEEEESPSQSSEEEQFSDWNEDNGYSMQEDSTVDADVTAENE